MKKQAVFIGLLVVSVSLTSFIEARKHHKRYRHGPTHRVYSSRPRGLFSWLFEPVLGREEVVVVEDHDNSYHERPVVIVKERRRPWWW